MAPKYLLLKIKDIVFLENNPRKITKTDFKKLCADIKADPNFLIEKDTVFCDVIISRWEAFTNKKAVNL